MCGTERTQIEPAITVQTGRAMITINNPDIEIRLEEASASAGMPVMDYVLQVLNDSLASNDQGGEIVPENAYGDIIPGTMSGADMIAFWKKEGIVRRRDDLPDSPVYARQLRERAERRTG
jgi:hypothetical protein